MVRTIFSVVLLFCLAAAGAQERSVQPLPSGAPLDFTYYPGEVAINLGLEDFLPDSLHGAVQALKGGDLDTARHIFGQEVKSHPDDLAAQIGYLQAMRGRLESLLPKYEQDVANAPSAADSFKLGVLAYYLSGSLWREESPSPVAKRDHFARLAKDSLEKAYRAAPLPIVGFTLVQVYVKVPSPVHVKLATNHKLVYEFAPRIPVYEDMLRRFIGDRAFVVYVAARENGWTGELPPTPQRPRNELRQLSYLVSCLWSQASARYYRPVARKVNGRTVTKHEWDTIPPERQRQIAWLAAWRQQIREAWGWKPAGSTAGK